MGTLVGRIWKRWPIQAARDGRAVLRIDGTRYERQLVRIESGEILEGITGAIRDKYPSQLTREGGRGRRLVVVRGRAALGASSPGVCRCGLPMTRIRAMQYFYWGIGAVLVVTVLAVLFVPGVDDFVERTFQGYVGRAAR